MKKSFVIGLLVATVIVTMSFTLGGLGQKIKPGKGISMEVPKDFIKLSEEDVIKKFGMFNLPLAVYTDPTGKTSLSINFKQDTIKYRGTKGIKRFDPLMERLFLKSTIKQTFKNVSFELDTVFSVNGKNFLAVEFDGTLEGKDSKGNETLTKSYNYILHGFDKNKKFIFNFGTPLDEKKKRQKATRKMFQSIKI